MACKGKGESPNPEAVNQAVYLITKSWMADPYRHVAIHCTHGFNRTGGWLGVERGSCSLAPECTVWIPWHRKMEPWRSV